MIFILQLGTETDVDLGKAIHWKLLVRVDSAAYPWQDNDLSKKQVHV